MWSLAIEPTPILNTPFFSRVFGGSSGSEISENEQGIPFSFEWVALPGTPLWIEEEKEPPIVRVSAPHYPKKRLFADFRSLRLSPFAPPFPPPLEPASLILERMRAALGKPYVWGGNWSPGLFHWLDYYPPLRPLENKTKALWTFSGVDSTGLLYEATLGAVPRTIEELSQFGREVCRFPLSEKEFFSSLRPLDMIFLPSSFFPHVLFVEDLHHCMESQFSLGVVRKNLQERFREFRSSFFSVRRFLQPIHF